MYISDCIPNVPADLNISIHVTGDFFFFRERGWDFLMEEACRAYLVWNVIYFFIYPSPPTTPPPTPKLPFIQLALTFAQVHLAEF